jgi:serine/threonine-protein kinase RsbW
MRIEPMFSRHQHDAPALTGDTPPVAAGTAGQSPPDAELIPMTADNWTWSLERQIASDSAAASDLIDRLLSKLIELGWQDHDTFGVHLALEEALANAIKHGNCRDKDKSIDVSLQVSPERVHVEIADQGPGFDPQAVPDPTEEANLELPTGRGLMLMRSYMTSVEFNERGNRVVMEKQRSRRSQVS